ncbi:MAG: hypothetical protein PW734_03260 [Verrucomicrobium sp.]|nr:hypothetical protein [Verrucomicrobium sp.]
MRRLFLTLLSLFVLAAALRAEDLDPARAIEKRGSLAISDGFSYYLFRKDGTFESKPLGLSGRTIEGTWEKKPGRKTFVIQGNWGWVNGVGPAHDRRRMVLSISSGEFRKENDMERHCVWGDVFKGEVFKPNSFLIGEVTPLD